MRALPLLLMLASMCVGCYPSAQNPPAVRDSSEFQGLLMASGGHYFVRDLPEDLAETDWIYLALAYPDGRIKTLLGMSEQGVPYNSDTAKVYFFEGLNDNIPSFALQISEGTVGRSTLGNLSWKLQTSGKPEGAFDLPMMRFSNADSISSTGDCLGKIPEGSFDLVLVRESKQPSAE